MSFVGLDSQIATPFGVQVPNAPGTGVVEVLDAEDQTHPEGATEHMNAQYRRYGNPSGLTWLQSARRLRETQIMRRR